MTFVIYLYMETSKKKTHESVKISEPYLRVSVFLSQFGWHIQVLHNSKVTET